MTSHSFSTPSKDGLRLRGRALPGLRAAAVASLSCLLIAGCGGGSSGDVGGATARGDGAASAAVPLIAAPDPEKCAQTGTAVQGSPLLNSQLDCAP